MLKPITRQWGLLLLAVMAISLRYMGWDEGALIALSGFLSVMQIER